MSDSDLDQVPQWLTVPDVAEVLGVSVTAVRRLIEDRELLAARVGERRILSVPAAFFLDAQILPALRGTFTVLADAGFKDEEIIGWLFSPEETWPVEGAAIDALRAGLKTEVRRRAMEAAF